MYMILLIQIKSIAILCRKTDCFDSDCFKSLTFPLLRPLSRCRYSKRALLGGVYMASELYMLTDYSPNFEDTVSFMDRQLREVQSKGAMAGLMFQQAEAMLQQALQSMKDGRPK